MVPTFTIIHQLLTFALNSPLTHQINHDMLIVRSEIPFIWNEMFHMLQITMQTHSFITKNFKRSQLWSLLSSSNCYHEN